MEEWLALSLCPLCGQSPESQNHGIRDCSHPAQQAIRLRAYETLNSQGAALSEHKQDVMRFLAKLSQETYGSRVALGTCTECQLSALKAQHIQVDRETAECLLGLFHGPMELMIHSLWDSRAVILSGNAAEENQGA